MWLKTLLKNSGYTGCPESGGGGGNLPSDNVLGLFGEGRLFETAKDEWYTKNRKKKKQQRDIGRRQKLL